ncbi:MAG: prepilin-type N-terminal cleavage/methylation domain-containing protein [Candidatus Omnitrophota bacterium]|nr:prepilin-type N-terminal cleavage/methylation domain-containing protein [Candidatus Omnitrophota bacterium]
MRKGFTLLELLIVVIIIGILAVFAVPQLLQSTYRAKEAKAVQTLGAMHRAYQTAVGVGQTWAVGFPIEVKVLTGTAIKITDPTDDDYTYTNLAATGVATTKAATQQRTVTITYVGGGLAYS